LGKWAARRAFSRSWWPSVILPSLSTRICPALSILGVVYRVAAQTSFPLLSCRNRFQHSRLASRIPLRKFRLASLKRLMPAGRFFHSLLAFPSSCRSCLRSSDHQRFDLEHYLFFFASLSSVSVIASFNLVAAVSTSSIVLSSFRSGIQLAARR
jgi:hypothetical protein